MGQDISWPCAENRKEQERRVMQSKYANSLNTEENDKELYEKGKFAERRHNIDKIQEIIERKSYSANKYKDSTEAEWKPKSSQPLSPAHSTGTQSAFTFTDDSAAGDGELPVVFIVDEIENIESFLRKYSDKYGEMNLSMIIPHPSKEKAVAVLQSANLISNITAGKQNKLRDFEKDLRKENKNNAYQILVKFLKQKYDEGLDYLGYYLDKQGIYHFVFSEKIGKQNEKTNLDFLTLSDMSQNEIQTTLNKAIKEHYKMKGIITLIESEESSRSLSFIILERKKVNISQYFIVNIAGETFETNGPNLDFSRKIELGCQSDELDVAGLITCHEEDSLYLVFSKLNQE